MPPKSPAPTRSKEETTGNKALSRDNKLRLAENVVADIEKSFGTGSVWKGSDKSLDIEAVSTGSLSLDIATGIGGLPRGRIVEIYGPESSGKTTVCLHVIAEAQRNGGLCAFVDMENALDPTWAERLGVLVNELYISQPDNGEQALEIAQKYIASGVFDVVVVDSVAALVPISEITGNIGDSHVGLQARLMSQSLRILSTTIKQSNTLVLFTNQLRSKIGVMFGSPETTAGGNALKYYASVRLDIRRIQSIKVGEEAIGNRTKVTIKKNKVAAPFKEAEFDILFDEGISILGEIIDLGAELGVVDKKGAFYRYNDELIGQGREKARQYLMEHETLAFEIHNKLREAKKLPLLTVQPVYNKLKNVPAGEAEQDPIIDYSTGEILDREPVREKTKKRATTVVIEQPIVLSTATEPLDDEEDIDLSAMIEVSDEA